MTRTDHRLNDSLEILIAELTSDEELRDSFLRNPRRTMELASEWGLPLSDSELHALRAPRLWNRVTEELEARFLAAA